MKKLYICHIRFQTFGLEPLSMSFHLPLDKALRDNTDTGDKYS